MSKRIRMEDVYNDMKSVRRYDGILDITQEEWVKWWKDTGLWDQRAKPGGYYMARIDTEQPFRLDNIICATKSDIMNNYYKKIGRSRK